MFLFADSGSTKTNWIITDSDYQELKSFSTIGLNPYFTTKEMIIRSLVENFPPDYEPLQIKYTAFYGAGCSNNDNFEHLKNALEEYLYNSKVDVYSDMLGAARGVLLTEPGIAAIIGTGTNSCLYNGDYIEKGAVSLGYILGDEGSGAYIGKIFLKQYLEFKFDRELTQKIYNETGANLTNVLTSLYRGQNPNKYLASFCPFIKNNISHPQLDSLLRYSFRKFFNTFIFIFSEPHKSKIGLVGSIATYFSDIILEVAKEFDIKDIRVIQDPLRNIIKFHSLKNHPFQ
ncbi:MAG TPA: hypothetical protein P5538_02865 [Bacteroidales bacterium]|jgi:N-acetylglucosamine kinase-like BadF-type ATPase|nr:hypothetical protein [Bacteroidales bacterium]HOL97139.1 hypothetical protein [Bacteroidales bacterium]HOM35432.1 hypothetical protein [Bacteroidales bacterium]HPD23077.1 hypothetical protein [Bacteroidales bacterium]HRS99365.1 hypothetical protein [Bacteroidales bacterium]